MVTWMMTDEPRGTVVCVTDTAVTARSCTGARTLSWKVAVSTSPDISEMPVTVMVEVPIVAVGAAVIVSPILQPVD